jgi:hypothetical protein
MNLLPMMPRKNIIAIAASVNAVLRLAARSRPAGTEFGGTSAGLWARIARGALAFT